MPPAPLAWLSAFCARRKMLASCFRFVLCDMLKGKREVQIISYKQVLCQVKAFTGNLVTDKIHYRKGQWRFNISFKNIFVCTGNMRPII